VFRLWNIFCKRISKHSPKIYSIDHYGLLFLRGKIVPFCYNCGTKHFLQEYISAYYKEVNGKHMVHTTKFQNMGTYSRPLSSCNTGHVAVILQNINS
jgi:hypothetical protein